MSRAMTPSDAPLRWLLVVSLHAAMLDRASSFWCETQTNPLDKEGYISGRLTAAGAEAAAAADQAVECIWSISPGIRLSMIRFNATGQFFSGADELNFYTRVRDDGPDGLVSNMPFSSANSIPPHMVLTGSDEVHLQLRAKWADTFFQMHYTSVEGDDSDVFSLEASALWPTFWVVSSAHGGCPPPARPLCSPLVHPTPAPCRPRPGASSLRPTDFARAPHRLLLRRHCVALPPPLLQPQRNETKRRRDARDALGAHEPRRAAGSGATRER